jgi:16S rRNA (adenine1518-N6/adenine1519-N6)-dimethyltransferase
VTHGPADIHELLEANELHPSRALGQNFVADGNTVRRIVRLAGIIEGRRVVEIGAGLGSLTLALAEAGARVTAVEIDRYVVPVLRTQVEPLGVRVVEADALVLDWAELLGPDSVEGGSAAGGSASGGSVESAPADESWALVANLPYNVAVPLVIRVLEEAPQITSQLVMVQREVGERLAASAGDEAYGAVSVKVAYWATASVVGRVPASVFIPRPRVESVLVRLDRRPDRVLGRGGSGGPAQPVGPGDPTYDRLFAVVRGGFAHRRKMLRRSLEDLVRPEAFEATGIRPTARAEELDLADWERLASWPPEEQPHGTHSAHRTGP